MYRRNYYLGNKIEQMRKNSHQPTHQNYAQFVLQNMLIFNASSRSKYKLKLNVPNFASQEKVHPSSVSFVFKVPFENIRDFNSQEGTITLLQKIVARQNAEYAQIGRGTVDFSSLQVKNKEKHLGLSDGLIYGTRSFNKDKLIARFSYCIIKKQNHEDNLDEVNQFINIDSPKRKQRLPMLAYKQSMQKHKQIENKLQLLTKQFEETLKPAKQSQQKMSKLNQSLIQTLKQDGQQLFYFYRYSEKLSALYFHNNEKFKVIRVEIKDLKLDLFTLQRVPKLTSSIYLNPKKCKRNKNAKNNYILLTFYEIFEKQLFKRKLIQVIISYDSISYQLSENAIFYLPQTDNNISFQMLYQRLNEKVIDTGTIKTKDQNTQIVEIFNKDLFQSGFFIVNFQKKLLNPIFQDRNYTLQQKQFQRLFCQLQQKKIKLQKKRYSLPSKRDDYLVQSHVSKKSQIDNTPINSHVKERMKKLIMPEFFGRIKTTGNQLLQSRGKNSSLKIFTPGGKDKADVFSTQNSAPHKDYLSKVKIRILNYDNSKRNIALAQNLQIQSISINIESAEYQKTTKVLVKYDIDNMTHLKKAYVHRKHQLNPQWNTVDIKFQSIVRGCFLKINIFSKEKKKDQQQYMEIGYSTISYADLKSFEGTAYRSYIVSKNKIIGCLLLQFKLVHEKILYSPVSNEIDKGRLSPSRNNQFQVSLNNSVIHTFNRESIASSSSYSSQNRPQRRKFSNKQKR